MIKEKLNGIFNKIKNNKKKVIGITASVVVAFIFTFAVYNLNNPTYFNRLFANVLNNGVPANSNFEDNTFYSCVVDAYNRDHQDNKKAYTDNLTDEELASITSLECQGWNYSDDAEITSAKGIEKLTGLTTLDLYGNKLTNIDLGKNTALTNLKLNYNELANIDLSKNTNLTELDLSCNNLISIDLSKNTVLKILDLGGNQLTNIDLNQNILLIKMDLNENFISSLDVSSNTSLTYLDLSNNLLTSIDLSKNVALTNLELYNNQLTSLDLSKNVTLINLYLDENDISSLDLSKNKELSWLGIDDTPLKEDILMQTGETYQIEEKIIPSEGQNITYSIGDTSVASVDGNTITAQIEGSTTLTATFGNVSFNRKLVVGSVKVYPKENDWIKVNNDEKYIYTVDQDISDLRTNIGNIVEENDIIKVVFKEKVLAEYKHVYIKNTIRSYNDNYLIMYLSADNPNYNNAINCTYDLSKDGKELSIKYDGKEIDIEKVVYVYLPFKFKILNGYLVLFENLKLSNYKDMINIINVKDKIDKNKINVLNGSVEYDDEDECFNLKSDLGSSIGEIDDSTKIYSDSYDLSREYIYLGTNELNGDSELIFYEKGREINLITSGIGSIDNGVFKIIADHFVLTSWDLIKVISDKYDMSGDTINLGNEDIDLSKINVTNATLKVDNNKLLVMYGDEVVKEFKLEGGKKTTTTTKKDDEKTTTTKDKTTTKEETKTITTKKKVSIIDKIFGNKETTTVKKEETTTKKNIFRKSTTTKVENSSGNVTSNNKNSFKKLVTGSNLLILFLSITGIALIIYIIIDKKKNKEA